jgi:hypothetical protein
MEDREIIELQRDVMKRRVSLFHASIIPYTYILPCVHTEFWLWSTEQDESLDRLEETIVSTKHIALAINEELDLHTRLIVSIA